MEKEEKFTTKMEAKAHILGRIAGLNEVRIAFLGIGYDKDETAQKIRRLANEEIFKLKEILEIDYLGSGWFESAQELLKKDI